MALCGISRIDDLMAGAVTTAIAAGDSDREAVQVIQSLLTGQAEKGLPSLLSDDFGDFGAFTTEAVRRFRMKQGLPTGNQVDARVLQSLVTTPAPAAIVSRGYITLVLDFEYGGLAKILSIVAQMEGAGKFGALNLNTDKAGLSFGLIQWAQKPGRLAEILNAFFSASAAAFVRIFGGGDANLAAGLIAHAKQVDGGVDRATGVALDSDFDLVTEPWVGRFRAAAMWAPFQRVQVQTALSDFQSSLAMIQQYAPQLTSERAVGFMLDLVNQCGNSGARAIYRLVWKDGMPLAELLRGMANASVERVADSWKAGTLARREHFLNTTFLSDDLFTEGAGAARSGTR